VAHHQLLPPGNSHPRMDLVDATTQEQEQHEGEERTERQEERQGRSEESENKPSEKPSTCKLLRTPYRRTSQNTPRATI